MPRAAILSDPGLPFRCFHGPFDPGFTVIASEAKQSIVPRKGGMDCFVASLLAMTAGRQSFTISRRDLPELLQKP
jgi:hypothetical protein